MFSPFGGFGGFGFGGRGYGGGSHLGYDDGRIDRSHFNETVFYYHRRLINTSIFFEIHRVQRLIDVWKSVSRWFVAKISQVKMNIVSLLLIPTRIIWSMPIGKS